MNDYNYIFVSDFHVAIGQIETNRPAYHPREDFFYDESFFRFLRWANENPEGGKKWELVFNGDCFDFWPLDTLLMEELPDWEDIDFDSASAGAYWEREIKNLPKQLKEGEENGGQSVMTTLKQTVVADTIRQIPDRLVPSRRWYKNYNIRQEKKAERYYSILKLFYIQKGHPRLFEALGWWIAAGHRLVMMRGNHDLEIYWDDVQANFKKYVYKNYRLAMEQLGKKPTDFAKFAQKIDFSHSWFYHRPGIFYAEHGSQYEPANSASNFLHPKHPNDPKNSLNWPLGSLIVQYLLSPLEDKYPELENRGSYVRFIFNLIVNEPEKVVRTVWRSFFAFYRAARRLWQQTKSNPGKPTNEDFKKYADTVKLPVGIVQELYAIGEKPLLAYRGLTFLLFNPWSIAILSLLGIGIAIGLLWFYFYPFLTQLNEEIILLTNWVAGIFTWKSLSLSKEELAANTGLFTRLGSIIALLLGRAKVQDWLSKLAAWALKLVGKRVTGNLKLFDTDKYLFTAARKVHEVFTQNESSSGPAPKFYIFGHDHRPDSREIPNSGGNAYYLNTGAWLPSFREETERLRAGDKDVEFTFLKIWHDRVQYVHELLQWNDDALRQELQIVPFDKKEEPKSHKTLTTLSGVLLGAFIGVWLKQLIFSLFALAVAGYIVGFIWNWRERSRLEREQVQLT